MVVANRAHRSLHSTDCVLLLVALFVVTYCRANRPVTAFAALLCLLACFNSLYVPLHLEDVVLSHPRTAGMLAAGRLPTTWETTSDLGTLGNQLQDGSLQLTQSYVTQKAILKVAQGKRAGMWRISIMPDVRLPDSMAAAAKAGSRDAAAGTVPSSRYSSSFAAWVAAVEDGPWNNSTWAAEAVDGLRSGLNEYQKECAGVFPYQQNVWKHHYDIFRMQVGVVAVLGCAALRCAARRWCAHPIGIAGSRCKLTSWCACCGAKKMHVAWCLLSQTRPCCRCLIWCLAGPYPPRVNPTD